jgi:uncharacterized protein YoxC
LFVGFVLEVIIMMIEEILVKVGAAILSIGAILFVIYYINKKAYKRAERMNEEFKKLEAEQDVIARQNEELNLAKANAKKSDSKNVSEKSSKK